MSTAELALPNDQQEVDPSPPGVAPSDNDLTDDISPAAHSGSEGYRIVLFARFMDKALLAGAATRLVPVLHKSLPSLLLIDTFHASASHPASADHKIAEGECMQLVTRPGEQQSVQCARGSGGGVVRKKNVRKTFKAATETSAISDQSPSRAPASIECHCHHERQSAACDGDAPQRVENHMQGKDLHREPQASSAQVSREPENDAASTCAVSRANPRVAPPTGVWEQLLEARAHTDDGRPLLHVVLRYTPHIPR